MLIQQLFFTSAFFFTCDQEKRKIDLLEIYNFLESSLALQIRMGEWNLERRMLDVNPLAVGPENFEGRTLAVASFLVRRVTKFLV